MLFSVSDWHSNRYRGAYTLDYLHMGAAKSW